jgi:hypothetical protein
MNDALLAAARRGGAPVKNAEQARRVMMEQVADAERVVAWLDSEKRGKKSELSPTMLQLINDTRVAETGPHAFRNVSRITLAETAHERVQLVAYTYTDRGELAGYKVETVPLGDAQAHPTTLAELHAHKLGTLHAIDAAVQAAAARSPKADGFAQRVSLTEALRGGAPASADLELLRAYRTAGQFPSLMITGETAHALMLDEKGGLVIHAQDGRSSYVSTRVPTELDLERRQLASLHDLELAYRAALIEHAGLSGKPTDEKLVARARDQVRTQIQSIQHYLERSNQGTDARLLEEHYASGGENRREYYNSQYITFFRPAVLAQSGDRALVWGGGALRVTQPSSLKEQISLRGAGKEKAWVQNGIGTSIGDSRGEAKLAAATYHDLVELGLPDQASFDRAMLNHMVRVAGLGDPRALTLAEVRQVLRQQIEDEPALVKAIEGEHVDAKRLFTVYQQGHPAAPGKTSALVLLKHAEGDLVMGNEAMFSKPSLYLKGKAVTVAQLRRMGLGTIAQLEAAIHTQMLALDRRSYH